MDDSRQFGRSELRDQLRLHLETLQLAGVHWLPNPSAPIVSVPETVEGLRVKDSAGSPETNPPANPTRSSLPVLAQEVAACTRCPELVATRTQTVFGVGPVGAELCFVGEAPGGEEDAQGEPFVGPAGQLLNRIINACGLRREDVYICNILKCRPPGNRTPSAQEMAHCRGHLERQLELVRPKFICALGSTAVRGLLGSPLSLARLRGRFHDFRGIPVLVTYHPAYMLPHRNPDPAQLQAKKKAVWDDMKLLMQRMGRTVK